MCTKLQVCTIKCECNHMELIGHSQFWTAITNYGIDLYQHCTKIDKMDSSSNNGIYINSGLSNPKAQGKFEIGSIFHVQAVQTTWGNYAIMRQNHRMVVLRKPQQWNPPVCRRWRSTGSACCIHWDEEWSFVVSDACTFSIKWGICHRQSIPSVSSRCRKFCILD